MRQEVIAAIFGEEGIAGMLRLSAAVKAPGIVGAELPKVS